MLGQYLTKLPAVRGKQRLLLAFDAAFGPSVLRARQGILLEGFLSSTQDLAFCRRKSENPALEALIASIPSDGVFVDCGANCGFYSALAATKLGPQGIVLSVEASHREYRRLLKAIELNPHRSSWIPLHLAAGSKAGSVRIDTSVGHTGMNRVVTTKSSASSGNTIACFRLDELFAATIEEGRAISLLKIDVEGFEREVLAGLDRTLSEKRIASLVIEITPQFLEERGESKAELFGWLEGKGYLPTINSNAWQYDEVFVASSNR